MSFALLPKDILRLFLTEYIHWSSFGPLLATSKLFHGLFRPIQRSILYRKYFTQSLYFKQALKWKLHPKANQNEFFVVDGDGPPAHAVASSTENLMHLEFFSDRYEEKATQLFNREEACPYKILFDGYKIALFQNRQAEYNQAETEVLRLYTTYLEQFNRFSPAFCTHDAESSCLCHYLGVDVEEEKLMKVNCPYCYNSIYRWNMFIHVPNCLETILG